MKYTEIALIGPTKAPIAGLLTKSGEICTVKCFFSHHNGQNNFFFEIPEGLTSQLASKDGDRIFVDQNGEHWPSEDVMWESTPTVT